MHYCLGSLDAKLIQFPEIFKLNLRVRSRLMFSLRQSYPPSRGVRQIQIFMRKTRGLPAQPAFAAQRANAYLILHPISIPEGVQKFK